MKFHELRERESILKGSFLIMVRNKAAYDERTADIS